MKYNSNNTIDYEEEETITCDGKDAIDINPKAPPTEESPTIKKRSKGIKAKGPL